MELNDGNNHHKKNVPKKVNVDVK